MQKSKVKTIAQSGQNNWKDKVLTKWFVQLEDGSNGTLTTGFKDTEKAPEVGEEIEFEIVDKGFGPEIKLKQEGGGGGGFGGRGESPEKRRSIQKQTALKEAVLFVGYQDPKHRTGEAVIRIAEKFSDWLAEEPQPKATPAPANLRAVPVTPQAEPEGDDLPF